MKRPNKIDWFVYWVFYMWWNPIFENNQELAESFYKIFGMNLKRSNTTKAVKATPSPTWWTE